MTRTDEDRRLRDPHPRPPVWVGDIVAAILIITSAFIPFPNAEFRPGSPLVVLLVVAPAVLLPLRRRWPIPILGAVIAFYGAAALTGTLAPGVVIAAAIAMFGVATRSVRRTTVVAAAGAMVAIALLSLLASVGSFDPRTLQFALTIAFAAAAGDGARSRREYIAAITERAERAEQTREAEASRRVAEERLRIARDLHDTVAHQISVISLNAGVASSSLETRPEKAKEALSTIRRASRTVLGEIGDLLEVLRSTGEQERVTLPQPGLDRLDALVDEFSTAGLDITTRIPATLPTLSAATDTVAYRVIQEGLTNALKHGLEHRAHVLLESSDSVLTVTVTNPAGPDDTGRQQRGHEDARAGAGHGLLGIRERVTAVRGAVEAGPVAGGWRLSAALPLSQEGPA